MLKLVLRFHVMTSNNEPLHCLTFMCNRRKERVRKKQREGKIRGSEWDKVAFLPSQVRLTSHPTIFDSPQTRVALGCLTEEMVEKISGVEVAQHDCRMRTWSSWSANPWLWKGITNPPSHDLQPNNPFRVSQHLVQMGHKPKRVDGGNI